MLETIWGFLNNSANQTTLTWLGGGVAVAAGGIWAIIKFFAKKPEPSKPQPMMTASNGGVVIGGANTDSPITTNKSGSVKK